MKKLSLCLAFCLILTMIPIGTMLAFAEETDPWKLGDTAYSTLDGAIEKAQNGDTIYLTQDLTEAVTVDLGGRELTIEGEQAAEGSYPTITVGTVTAITVTNGTLTLKNINATSSGTAQTATLVLGTDANVTLENVTLKNTGGATISTSNTTVAPYLTLKSGTIFSSARAAIEPAKNTTLIFTMHGGKVESTRNYGINAGNSGSTMNAVIYDGEIYGNTCAMTGSYLSATVYGGTFSVKDENSYGIFYYSGKYTILGGTFKNGPSIIGGKTASENVRFAYPEGATSLTLQPVMQTGASIRTNADSWGIRFRSTLPTVWLDYLNTAGIDVTYGTLICPIDVLGETDFTVDNEKVLVNIVAKDGISTDGTNTVLSAALVNLKTGNETRNFAARAYISFTIDGETHTVYSDFSETDHVRSMVQVAQKALADVADTAEGEYTTAVTKWYDADGNLVENSGTKYSCYSETDLEAIWSYVS
ncbi:MAG: hypothetical protein IJW55_06545 [Clostridia bacterium]|nr:hypothetical protein [Clostridia bacterium]